MFLSKVRPIVVSQYDHALFAGILASNWGNQNFDRPPFDFDAFVAGVTFHDWHFGFFDTAPIGNMDFEPWFQIILQGEQCRFPNPITDIVAKLHIRRLLSTDDEDAARAMVERLDRYIEQRLTETDFSIEPFRWADSITRICDRISFHFCFETATELKAEIAPRLNHPDTVSVTLKIENGSVTVNPWPFAVDVIRGTLVAYEQDGYPGTLRPLTVPYVVKPG